jgi:NAD(P)-dependent dehydrogenase (short-subunit alcohol dehydrogenase family)
MTDMVRAVGDDTFIEMMVDSTQQKRIAEPEEIVPSVLLLASDAGSYMNGCTVTVDGGSMA